ncbi:MAG: hypothetical protein K0R57_3195 [Paenibacillaceae bacterium]|jgi:hypothetical protein|nr:hypothetical protein [Paenibacillaceae bacterium]
MITCNECGKVNGEGDIGEHWICDSCKVPEPQEEEQPDRLAEKKDKQETH